MEKRAKYFIFIVATYIFFAFFSLRNLLFKPGIVGHNWDWSVPPLPENLAEIGNAGFFAWTDFSLGQSNILSLPYGHLTFAWTSLRHLGFSSALISKLLLIVTIVISGITMYLLVRDILESSFKNNIINGYDSTIFSAFLGGFFYAFSPYLFCEFIGGANTQFFAYAIFPLVLLFFRKANLVKAQNKVYILFTAITLSIITISLQKLFLVTLILLSYSLFQSKRFHHFKNFVIVYILYGFINLYWIIPTIFNITSVQTFTISKDFLFLGNIKHNVPSILNIFVATGYARPFFHQLLSPLSSVLWIAVSYSLIGAIFYISLINDRRKEVLFWLVILLTSFIFSTGGKPPFGNLVIWLYKKFFIFHLFRSPQHFIIVPTFCLALLIGFSAFLFFKKIRNKSRFILRFNVFYIAVFVLLLVWVHPFLVQGDLGMSVIQEMKEDSDFKGDKIDLYQLSPGYREVMSFLNRNNSDFRILFLPMTGSPYYLKTEYQSEAQGGDPLLSSPHSAPIVDMVIDGYAKTLSLLVKKNIYDSINFDSVEKIINLQNIKYIIVRSDVVPNFGYGRDHWDLKRVKKYLAESSQLVKLKEYKYIEIYLNKKFIPHIYSSPSLISIKENTDSIITTYTSYLDDYPPLHL